MGNPIGYVTVHNWRGSCLNRRTGKPSRLTHTLDPKRVTVSKVPEGGFFRVTLKNGDWILVDAKDRQNIVNAMDAATAQKANGEAPGWRIED